MIYPKFSETFLNQEEDKVKESNTYISRFQMIEGEEDDEMAPETNPENFSIPKLNITPKLPIPEQERPTEQAQIPIPLLSLGLPKEQKNTDEQGIPRMELDLGLVKKVEQEEFHSEEPDYDDDFDEENNQDSQREHLESNISSDRPSEQSSSRPANVNILDLTKAHNIQQDLLENDPRKKVNVPEIPSVQLDLKQNSPDQPENLEVKPEAPIAKFSMPSLKDVPVKEALKGSEDSDTDRTGPELKMNIFNLKKVQELKDREVPSENGSVDNEEKQIEKDPLVTNPMEGEFYQNNTSVTEARNDRFK